MNPYLEGVVCRHVTIGNCPLPYIVRHEYGQENKYICQQTAEHVLLGELLRTVHPSLVACARVRSRRIDRPEAVLLNAMASYHPRLRTGREICVGADFLVRVVDVSAVYRYLVEIHHRMLGQPFPDYTFGFVRGRKMGEQDTSIMVPYTTRSGVQYVPKFCMDGLGPCCSRMVSDWAARRLHACFTVMGIHHGVHPICSPEPIEVIRLDDYQRLSASGTRFLDYWPTTSQFTVHGTGQLARWTTLID